jgi:hypothetical protein
MRSNDPAFTDPALDVIRKTDPELAKRIDAAPEQITVVTDPYELTMQMLPFTNLHEALTAASEFGTAYGMTMQPATGMSTPLDYSIWLNRSSIEDKAAGIGVPVAKFTADIIAHEFTHHDGYGEREAYAAGTKFAREMREPEMAALSEAIARQENAI